MTSYGTELILDIHECNANKFNRKDIEQFMKELCERIDMVREDLYWWDDEDVPEEEKETEPHMKGTSAVQFIRTSNVTIHTLDILKRVYLNIFSCKDFDAQTVKAFAVEFFGGEIVNATELIRY